MNDIIEISVAMPVNGRKERKKITLDYRDGRIFISFGFNRPFMAEVKAMDGAKWHGYDEVNPRKIWSIRDSSRNRFQIKLWQFDALDLSERLKRPELNPYQRYDQKLYDTKTERKLRDYQQEMLAFVLTRKQCILAAEMGTGKSLVAIEMAERAVKAYRLLREDITTPDSSLVWYIGPKAGVVAVSRELVKWKATIKPLMLTYEGLTKVMVGWSDGLAPLVVILDESSKIKTPNSKRSQAALALANAIRDKWGDLGYVLLMTGTPAPKSPIDWWMQCETAYPGFIREGNIQKFKARLCLIENRESITGGVYPHVVTWLDDDKKCAKCGEFKEHENHDTRLAAAIGNNVAHVFQKAINEVEYLYKRMNGLVKILFKKDCLDLPDKQYELINLQPTPSLLRAAKLIRSTATRAIEALTLLRELADGFQYQEVQQGDKTCENCTGTGKETVKIPNEGIDVFAPFKEVDYHDEWQDCENCSGTGKVPKLIRETAIGSTPKDEYFINDLDEYDEIGRYIAWGGFTGTIDKLVEIARKYAWAVLRVDGRGYFGFGVNGALLDPNELLDAMDRSHPNYQMLLDKYPKLCFIGHPKAGGMALTLTASPVMLYYSNSFDGEARFQSEDRAHRLGMDENRGLLIKDLIVLDTDQLVLDNLKKKKRLQDMSMGEIDVSLSQMQEVRLF